MKLPEEAPVGIVDPLVQLTLGIDRQAVPRAVLRDEFSLEQWPSRSIVGYLFTQAYAESDEARSERTQNDHIAADLDLWVEMLDRNNIAMAGCILSVDDPDEVFDRIAARSDRVFVTVSLDPHAGMRHVRRLADLAGRYSFIRGVSLSPFGIYPFIAPNSKEYYPVYAKCVELSLAVFINVGVPGPRVPAWVQDPIHLDEICWFFPDLTVVMRHGGEPWADVCVKMLLRWPNLYYAVTAMAPRFYPDVIKSFMQKRGSEKVMFAGYWPSLSYDRVFSELQKFDLQPEVWRNFLSGNARRAFNLDAQ